MSLHLELSDQAKSWLRQQSVQLAPTNPHGCLDALVALHAAGDIELEDAERMARCYAALGMHEEAQLCRTAVEGAPGSPELWNNEAELP